MQAVRSVSFSIDLPSHALVAVAFISSICAEPSDTLNETGCGEPYHGGAVISGFQSLILVQLSIELLECCDGTCSTDCSYH